MATSATGHPVGDTIAPARRGRDLGGPSRTTFGGGGRTGSTRNGRATTPDKHLRLPQRADGYAYTIQKEAGASSSA